MSALTNVVFSLLYANSGRSLFEIASAITAHPVVARKIRKIKRHPQVTLVTRFVATASDFVKAHVPEVFSAISIPTINTSVSVTESEPEKLSKLEQELTKLREEIGLLMQAKLQLAVCVDILLFTGDYEMTLFPQKQQKPADAISNSSAGAVGRTHSIPPPPPPPPTRKNAKPSAAQPVNAESAEQSADAPAAAAAAAPEVIKSKIKKPLAVSLHQVIASGQPVALRRVDVSRSPGGTPIKSSSTSSLLDHSSFLSQALKRKFRHAVNSPPTTPADTPDPAPRKRNVAAEESTEGGVNTAAPRTPKQSKAPVHNSKQSTALSEPARAASDAAAAIPTEESSLISFDEAPPVPSTDQQQLLISFDDVAPSILPSHQQASKPSLDEIFMSMVSHEPVDKENDRSSENVKPQSPNIEKRKMGRLVDDEGVTSPGLKRAAMSVRTT